MAASPADTFVPSEAMLSLIGNCVARLTDVVLITEAEPLDAPGPRIVFVNDAFEGQTGYTREEVIGKTPRILQGPLTDRVELRRMSEAFRAWKTVRAELVNYTKSGEAFHVEMDIVPVADETGLYTHWVSIQRDVTRRKHAESEAATRDLQRTESIGTLAIGIAHDFNNIIAAILGNVVLGRQEIEDGQSARQALDQIDRAANRARGLVQQILAYGRRQPQAFVRQPLAPLIQASVELLRAALPSGVAVTAVLEDAALDVIADAGQLNQVLLNLGTNSWHAMAGNAGKITIRLSSVVGPLDDGAAGGRFALLEVKDDGDGMDAHTLAHLFEPYFTTKAIGQGTGLGLSVVWGIVKAHGATISVDSTPGNGATFSLVFPVLEGTQGEGRREDGVEARRDKGRPQAHRDRGGDRDGDSHLRTNPHARQIDGVNTLALPAAIANGALPAHVVGASRRVLLVDDDEVVLLMLEGILERAGFRVDAFTDPVLALACVAARPGLFDVVVTDLNMPEMSGLQLTRQLALIRPGLPVVLASGYVGDELALEGAQAGTVAVFRKETAAEDLGPLLCDLLDRTDAAALSFGLGSGTGIAATRAQ